MFDTSLLTAYHISSFPAQDFITVVLLTYDCFISSQEFLEELTSRWEQLKNAEIEDKKERIQKYFSTLLTLLILSEQDF